MVLIRQRLAIWALRYMPAWALSSVATLLGVWVAHTLTQNVVVIVLTGAWAETVVYYATLLWSDVRADRRAQAAYGLRGFGRTVLNLALEFGVAEAIDTLVVRPVLLLAAAQVIDDLTVALVLGVFVADLVFFVPAILMYEARSATAPADGCEGSSSGWTHSPQRRADRASRRPSETGTADLEDQQSLCA